MSTWLQRFWEDEPVITLVLGAGAVFNAFLALLLSFGVKLTNDQILAINTFASVFITWITRRQVTPMNGPLVTQLKRDAK